MSTVLKDDYYMRLVRLFPLKPIKSKKQFEQAIKVMKELLYRKDSLDNGETDYLSVLGNLITQYEKELPLLKIPAMTASQALAYLMQVNELTISDLASITGHKSNLSAFLSGKRGLSKENALRLAEQFKVSPALFLPKPKNIQ